MNIVAAGSCTSLASQGRSRSWNVELVETGSTVKAFMQGPVGVTTVISQINLNGTSSGANLQLAGGVFDTVEGCSTPLCYTAQGNIAAAQSGTVITGTLDGLISYESTTCAAANHQVVFTRR